MISASHTAIVKVESEKNTVIATPTALHPAYIYASKPTSNIHEAHAVIMAAIVVPMGNVSLFVG